MADDTLKIKEFVVDSVQLGDKYGFADHKLVIPKRPTTNLPDIYKSVGIRVLPPHELDVSTNSIMDVVPISTKVLGALGTGITHTLTGVYLLITGAQENGTQIHDFGSSDGQLSEKLMLDRDGTPGSEDFVITFDVIVKDEATLDRQTTNGVFEFADQFLQPIREILKLTNGRDADGVHEFHNATHPGKPKVTIVKQVAGQGAMYDNSFLAKEPSGMKDGVSIIDVNNFPILLTPNEYRDGAIHALV